MWRVMPLTGLARVKGRPKITPTGQECFPKSTTRSSPGHSATDTYDTNALGSLHRYG